MYPYYQIAEPIAECAEDFGGQSVFTDCYMLFNLPHPDTGKRYILAKQFPSLSTCTRARNEFVPRC
jgi:hypothetical protein